MTPKTRARKIAAARKRLDEARILLADVHQDMRDQGHTLSRPERDEWTNIVHALADLDKAATELRSL